MSFAPTSPVTGTAVTGLTSPTYTLSADVAPNLNGKQYAISALGGTQTGVDINTVSKPFTSTFFRPPQLKILPAANPITGIVKSFPVNTYKLVTRKGAQPAANQQPQVVKITTIFEVVAGCETYEMEEVNAAISCHVGLLVAQATGISDTIKTGVF